MKRQNWPLGCKIFFVKDGKVYEARQTVPNTNIGYSGYNGYFKLETRRLEISEVKLTRRRDILQRFKSTQTRLARRRSGSVY